MKALSVVSSLPWLCAFVLPSIFVALAGHSPTTAWWTLISVPLSSGYGLADIALHALPLALIGAGAAIALRAGLFNIGGEGQFLAGCLLAITLTSAASVLGPASSIAFIVIGSMGGAAIGLLTAWLRTQFDANEILVSILLNYVMLQVASWAVRGPLQEPMRLLPRTAALPDAFHLPLILPSFGIHGGILIALLILALLAWLIARTGFGLRLAVLGRNPSAARYSGMDTTRWTWIILATSGALGGLAGAIEVAGRHHRFEDGIGAGLGLSAIAVALVARMNMGWIIPAALLFGLFHVGSGALQRQTGLPFPLLWIIQGSCILAIVIASGLRSRAPAVATKA